MVIATAIRVLSDLRDSQQAKLADCRRRKDSAGQERYYADVEALTVAIKAVEVKAPPKRGELPLWARFLSCAILGAAVAACLIYAAG